MQPIPILVNRPAWLIPSLILTLILIGGGRPCKAQHASLSHAGLLVFCGTGLHGLLILILLYPTPNPYPYLNSNPNSNLNNVK